MYYVSTVAGDGNTEYQDGPALSAKFNKPKGIALDTRNNIIVADNYNHAIRRISSDRRTVDTLVGNGEYGYKDGRGKGASFAFPSLITILQSGDFVVADDNGYIRKV